MSAAKILKLMKDKEVEYVDLRFTDPRGKLQHLTMDGKMVDENFTLEIRGKETKFTITNIERIQAD